jgi:hypothetical protein
MSRLASCLLLGLVVIACSEPTVDNTEYVYGGVFAGEDGTEAGSFSVTVVVETNSGGGTFLVNGAPNSFSTVTYNNATGAFAGSGGGFTFTGIADDSTLTGGYTSATGGGLFTGLRRTSTVSPVSYCGAHIGTHQGEPIAGPFTFVQGGGTRRGVFTSVLGDPFRGQLRSTSTAGPVTLDTLTGSASLNVTTASFTGIYEMAAGDTGAVEGIRCRSSVTSPIISMMEGVIGSFDGTELGDFILNLSSTGIGGSGSYTVGGVAKNLVAVVSGVNNQVAGFDTDFRFIGSLDTTTVSGTYARTGSVAGRVAGLVAAGQAVEKYCGQTTLGGPFIGAFSFIIRADSALFGLYTSGIGSAFQGDVSGKAYTDTASMQGQTGEVVILPSPGSFGGLFDFSLAGGPVGAMTGGSCP